MTTSLETLSRFASFDGEQGFYAHASAACASTMRFGVYVPASAQKKPAPVVFYLAGLTCNEETYAHKAGGQRLACELGLIVVTPDTSPRQTRYPGDDASWDFGVGAGFYIDATEAPWAGSYRMFSYVTEELPRLIGEAFPADLSRVGIMGHSMGGHGALVCALKSPGRYKSVSAFAPICAPTQCPWGEKAFTNYLGSDRETWKAWDAAELVRARRFDGELLVDQGTDDKFLTRELKPELLETACKSAGQPLSLSRREGFDHSYYFISTYLETHLRHHARALC